MNPNFLGEQFFLPRDNFWIWTFLLPEQSILFTRWIVFKYVPLIVNFFEKFMNMTLFTRWTIYESKPFYSVNNF
jgi:hypothetical protein